MTALLEAPKNRTATGVRPAARRAVQRSASWLRRHRPALLHLVPLLAITAAARLVNLTGAPQRIDDEGTYTAQAWAVTHLGSLAPYTYWYDHPPLGWLQISAWTWLTGGFDRYAIGVDAAREAMVVASVASAGLLWLLARRLGLGRMAASGAVLLFALTPLAVEYTRTVYLDNVATPWILAAFVLALTRSRQLVPFAGAAVCFAIAVLSKETSLLLLPFLAWQMWRSSHPQTRRYTLSVSAALLVLVGGGYLALAAIKGEVFPGANRVSLWDGITFQLVSRAGTGSVFAQSTQAGQQVRTWLGLGAVLLVGGLLAAVAALFVHRLRPYAAAYLLLTVLVLKPGYLPVPYVIAMLPLAALLLAGVLGAGLSRAHKAGPRVDRPNLTAALAGLGVLAVLGAAAVTWPAPLAQTATSDLDRPLQGAEQWLAENTRPGQKVLVDDASWLQLVRAGLDRDDVVWNYKADTDPQVSRRTPNGWKDYTYAEVTQGVRTSTGTSATLDQARRNGVVVAQFGDGGPDTVQIVRILPDGLKAFYAAQYTDQRARRAASAQLVDNERLQLAPAARSALVRGQVDSRLVLLLAQLAADHQVRVAGFPVVDGEQDNPFGRRRVDITAVDGQSVRSTGGRDLVSTVREQVQEFRPAVALRGRQLALEFPVEPPSYLLPAPSQ